MHNSSLALAFAGLLALSAPAVVSAQNQAASDVSEQPSPQALPGFGDLDKNSDGQLTRSEIPKDVDGLKPLRAHFLEADKDHNGRLSRSEYAAYAQSQLPASEKPSGQN